MNGLDFCQNPKNVALDHFLDFLGPPDQSGLFFKNWASSLFLLYDYLTSCKKLEKTDEPILKFSIVNR